MKTVIIGGGVVGLSTAYHLAQKKAGEVVILEKGQVGDGASSRAAGIYNMLGWHEPGIVTRRTCSELFRQFSDELEGYQFHNVGFLLLWRRGQLEDKQWTLKLYEQLGVQHEILDAGEIRRRWPALAASDDVVGVFDPLGGYSEPEEYVPALAARVRQLKVEVREQVQVTGIATRSGRVVGVTTSGGQIDADAVVCTTHVWTSRLLKAVGIRLPIKAFVHQRFVTTPCPVPLNTPAIGATWCDCYVRPAHGQRILAGISTLERAQYEVGSVEWDMAAVTVREGLEQQLTKELSSQVPQLSSTTWEECRMGLLAYPGDYEPILGPVRAMPGLFVGTCFHSNGFAYSPVAGRLLAEHVVDGRTYVDVSVYDPDRFSEAETEQFLGSTITQGQMVTHRPL